MLCWMCRKMENPFFYQIINHSADDISQDLNQLFVANFNRRRDKMRRKVFSECNDIQKELMLFLKNKRANEGKANFNNVTKVDN